VRDASGNLPLHLAVLLEGYEDCVAAAAADVCGVFYYAISITRRRVFVQMVMMQV